MMTNGEIEQKVREIISAKFAVPLDTIGAHTRLIEDLKVDSFGAVELMFELEESFGLNIPDSDIEHVRTVQQIVDYVSGWLQQKSANPPSPTLPDGKKPA
jgi:acyl carrier protein